MRGNMLGKKLFFVVIFMLGYTGVATAAAPVPWGAKLVKEDTATVNGQDQQMRSYEANTSKAEIIKYYLREMPGRGYSLFMNGENNAVFTKGETMVMVTVLPSSPGKTVFILVDAPLKIPTAADAGLIAGGAGTSCEGLPSVPVYPGARCTQSVRMKQANTIAAGYTIVGSVADVIGFYRSEMPRYMWKLVKETDLGRSLSDNQGSGQYKMTGDQAAVMQSIFSGAYSLNFINDKGNGCLINLMNAPGSKGMVIANITYEEKSSLQ